MSCELLRRTLFLSILATTYADSNQRMSEPANIEIEQFFDRNSSTAQRRRNETWLICLLCRLNNRPVHGPKLRSMVLIGCLTFMDFITFYLDKNKRKQTLFHTRSRISCLN